jgi:hypothetical protein
MTSRKTHDYYNTCKTATYVDHVQQRMRSKEGKNHLYCVHIHSERRKNVLTEAVFTLLGLLVSNYGTIRPLRHCLGHK